MTRKNCPVFHEEVMEMYLVQALWPLDHSKRQGHIPQGEAVLKLQACGQYLLMPIIGKLSIIKT